MIIAKKSKIRVYISAALFAGVMQISNAANSVTSVDWPVYGGTAAGDRYSTLTQIHRSNVKELQIAWRFDTDGGSLQTSPLVIGRTLFGYTSTQSVLALEAATGRLKWKFESNSENGGQPARGLSYWTDGKEQRLFASGGSYLYALDPSSGKAIPSFGERGRVDLRKHLDRNHASIPVFLTSPGVIYKNLIIVGFRTSETKPAARGAVRAYDVKTGQLRWTFNLIPKPGEAGHETWPAGAWKTAGAANVWAGLVLDEKRGIVYAASGSAADDFYGADRKGNNLYANSLVALDAARGKRIWHFQIVHHDLWDWDLPSPPVLLTVMRGGRSIDAVAQASKHGFVFLFDRVTGSPLFKIEEKRVPPSDVPGEQASSTQPFPLKPAPFARQLLTQDMVTARTPQAREAALKEFATFRNKGIFTPLAVDQPTVVFPGFDGGAEWGGSAVDRKNAVLYVNSNDIVWLGGLTESTARKADLGAFTYEKHCAVCHGLKREGSPPEFPALIDIASRLSSSQIVDVVAAGRGRMPGFSQLSRSEIGALITHLGSTQATAPVSKEVDSSQPGDDQPAYVFTGYKKWLDADGYPAVKPPWGTLNAIDMNSGEYLWTVPLGEYPELSAQGVPTTGTENYGGPVITAGGLLFIGATIYDRKLRAFDSSTGQELWKDTLPFAGVATPITYMVDGRQYVVIACSGNRDPKGPQGAAYIAFALTLPPKMQ